MKFNYCIGNPPYQDTTIGNNDGFAPPIYHQFMDVAFTVSNKVELITPARFLFNAGATPKSWNEERLQDEHFKVLNYSQKSSDVFVNTDIKGGVAITYRDATKDFGKIEVFQSYVELNNIRTKVEAIATNYLTDIIYASEVYKFTEKLHKDLPNVESMLSKGHKYDLKSNVFTTLADIVFFNEKPDDDNEYIKIFGLVKKERVYKYIRKDYIKNVANLDKYKVFVPAANGSGAIGEILSTPVIGEPVIGHTQTFISVGACDTKEEATNIMKYVKTKFARTMLSVLKITQGCNKSVWKYVPLQEFTSNSDIDWSQSISDIDKQLYKKYGLSEDEIKFIEKNVKEMK